MVKDVDKAISNEVKSTVVFNKYEMGRVLGKGTFAKVYYGRDLHSNESVAIKVLNKDQILRVPGMIDQIRREIAVMRLVRHPNVVSLREVMATKSYIYFVMEYVRGGELFAKVSRGRLPEDQVRRYFHQLISAVDFCHSRGVCHRDLKPENLLLDDDGNLKVSDFGLSALPEQLHHDGLLHTQCGTPAYVAPEILRRRGYDGPKADLWSCGVILYVLLAGFLPFQHENLMKMYRKIFKGEYMMPPWFSSEARHLVSRLLVVDPKERISIDEIKKLPWYKMGSIHSSLIPEPNLELEPEPEHEHNKEEEEKNEKPGTPRFYNAFELISSLSSGFNLSSLFDGRRRAGTVFTSRSPAGAIVDRLERVGRALGFKMGRPKEYKVTMEGSREGWKGRLVVAAEVFEVAEGVAVVEFSKNSGDTLEYTKFCEEEVRPGLKDIVWTWQDEDNCEARDG